MKASAAAQQNVNVAPHSRGTEGTVCTHLIVDAGFSEARGVVALVPGLDEGLGILWNSQVQAVHALLVMLVGGL